MDKLNMIIIQIKNTRPLKTQLKKWLKSWKVKVKRPINQLIDSLKDRAIILINLNNKLIIGTNWLSKNNQI